LLGAAFSLRRYFLYQKYGRMSPLWLYRADVTSGQDRLILAAQFVGQSPLNVAVRVDAVAAPHKLAQVDAGGVGLVGHRVIAVEPLGVPRAVKAVVRRRDVKVQSASMIFTFPSTAYKPRRWGGFSYHLPWTKDLRVPRQAAARKM
jgi:hypothetical protein